MTARPTAVFRFDASREIGAGHAVRSGALAHALAAEGWRTVCATREETVETVPDALESFDDVLRLGTGESGEIDEIAARMARPCEAIILDHYGRDRAFDRACRRLASCVTVIEDRPEAVHDCDILVNPSTDTGAHDSTTLDALVGPQYALLRPGFREARAQGELHRDCGSVLLLCGYTDERNATERLFDSLDGAPGVRSIDVVLGGANTHRECVQRRLRRAAVPAHLHVDPSPIAGLMTRTSLAVTAAGGTCWELACLGVPMVTVVTAQNQIEVDRTLREAGASASAGALDDALGARLRETVAALMADDARRRRMASRGRALVDGQGAKRVARAICARALSPENERRTSRHADVTLKNGNPA